MTKLAKYLKDNGIIHMWFARQIQTTNSNLCTIIQGRSAPSVRLAYAIEKKTNGAIKMHDWVKEEDKQKYA